MTFISVNSLLSHNNTKPPFEATDLTDEGYRYQEADVREEHF
jgi:hypothetical protein